MTIRMDTGSRRALRGALALAGGSLFAVTLSACYGMADDGSYYYDYDAGARTDAATATCSDPSLDLDDDGHCGSYDCDENDPEIHVGAPDADGDGIDHDCGGTDGAD